MHALNPFNNFKSRWSCPCLSILAVMILLHAQDGELHADQCGLPRGGGRGWPGRPGKAETHPVSLVLADQNMPRLDGIGLTRKLREHPRWGTTRS